MSPVAIARATKATPFAASLTQAVLRAGSRNPPLSSSLSSSPWVSHNPDSTSPVGIQKSEEARSAADTKEARSPPSTESAKSVAQADDELRQRLEAMSGGGGEAGLELEDGKPVAMKRGVKENMFRLI